MKVAKRNKKTTYFEAKAPPSSTLAKQATEITASNDNESLEYFSSCLQRLSATSHLRYNDFNMAYLNLLRRFFSVSFRFSTGERMRLMNTFELHAYKLDQATVTKAHSLSENDGLDRNVALTLNFEYSFFKLLKCILLDEERSIATEEDLKFLMSYCLRRCLSQFELFETSDEPSEDDADQQDELNLLEMYELIF